MDGLVVYRVPGYLSAKSTSYLEALAQAGWGHEVIDRLKLDLPRFESASILDDYETAMLVCSFEHHEAHIPFFKQLNTYIKALSRAARYEELQRKAANKDKDSIEAQRILFEIENRIVDKKSKSTNLSTLSDEDLQREIESITKRIPNE